MVEKLETPEAGTAQMAKREAWLDELGEAYANLGIPNGKLRLVSTIDVSCPRRWRAQLPVRILSHDARRHPRPVVIGEAQPLPQNKPYPRRHQNDGDAVARPACYSCSFTSIMASMLFPTLCVLAPSSHC
jgi:hypothetical protein